MPDQKQHRKKVMMRVLKTILALVIVCVIALAAWIYLVPMVTADAVTVYNSYTVATGDISTTKSFSASLSVKKSETFASAEEATVKEIYVQSGDEVQEGDSLILMSTGELFAASFDGVVNEIRVDVGDWVWPNFTVVQICDLEHLEVSMDVDEYDIEELTLGENCTVTVISLGIDFDTTIAHINRVSQSSGSVAFYSVTCDLTVPQNVLPGMQATVTIPSDSVQNVTQVDMAALAFDGDGSAYVLLQQSDGTYDKNYVETGITDGMNVEIVSGLTPGQTVYAEAGTESVGATVTLEDIYKSIVGETIVINDMSRSSGGMPGMGGTDGEIPDFSTMDGEMPDMSSMGGSEPQSVADETQTGDATDIQTGTGTTQGPSGEASTTADSGGQETTATESPTTNVEEGSANVE